MRILFMGTPDFAVPSLDLLAENGFRPIAVVTGADKPRGRGRRITPTAVKAAAQRLGIDTILQPNSVKSPAFAEQVRAFQPDIIVVVAFRILPRAVFEAARLGAFNLHASLLPRYRGAAPIQRALMAGEIESGVTTFFLQSKVDAGNIILRWPTQIDTEETAGMLHDRLMLLGARAVLETTQRIAQGRAHAMPQENHLAIPAPKIRKEDCLIPWHQDAPTVHNHCRGLSPFPGAWTRHRKQRLKILATRIAQASGTPGVVLESQGGLVIACGTGAIEVLKIQQSGRRRMNGAAFLRGYTLARGEKFY